jgi:hypothetical protein
MEVNASGAEKLKLSPATVSDFVTVAQGFAVQYDTFESKAP